MKWVSKESWLGSDGVEQANLKVDGETGFGEFGLDLGSTWIGCHGLI